MHLWIFIIHWMDQDLEHTFSFGHPGHRIYNLGQNIIVDMDLRKNWITNGFFKQNVGS